MAHYHVLTPINPFSTFGHEVVPSRRGDRYSAFRKATTSLPKHRLAKVPPRAILIEHEAGVRYAVRGLSKDLKRVEAVAASADD